ncbi:DUF6090 family protein [Robiginitalea sp. IMCC44478]|uniref:DUF6090 family protein n=1 Tax=Robiginitalea sp. IMCC44478 TaxID=3459122 RepID=UPI0040424474
MITFLRKIRRTLMAEKNFTKYLLYAIGEIVLVVIGILIALQINNTNEARKERAKEIHYLSNLKSDLQTTIEELDRYIEVRNGSIQAAEQIIAHIEGKPIEDIEDFNALGLPIYNWQKFYQNNNTFQELVNSGNLALISNDSIMNTLLNIETLYKKLKSEEEHYRFDTEELIYKPLYNTMDLNPMVNNFLYRVSDGAQGKDTPIPADYFDSFLQNTQIKNGFLMTILEYGTMNAQMQEMKEMAEALIILIDREIES